MKQEHKELLLKDLCARLPYDVKVSCNDKVYNFNGIQYFNICTLTDDNENNAFTTAGIKYIKPYLFPLSSMTEEQDKEFALLQTSAGKEGFLYAWNCATMMQWLLENHFDYNGLIEKGLAIDATNLNIY